ncbi:MAG: metallophosphoesterase family protein [Ktedonobacteraceae bacterium]|nr:metallophosphoesterase family protein [Ktedonobacteraceae bacterium]
MRVAIISDIHGNQVALAAVLEDLARQGTVDQIVVAGDLCLNGPRPREVLEMVQRLHCPVLQGNVDSEVVTKAPRKSGKKQNMAGWVRAQIGPEGVAYLAALPFSYRINNHKANSSDLLVVHANPLDQEQAIFPTASDSTLEYLLGGLDAGISALAFGHYHVAYQRRWRHLLLVDVGSCGLPRDGDLRASYAILTWRDGNWQAEHRRVPYDVEKVVQQIKESGMPNVEKRIKVLTEAKY